MAGVEDPNVIDVLGTDAAGTIIVCMVEPRSWGEDPQQVAQLLAR